MLVRVIPIEILLKDSATILFSPTTVRVQISPFIFLIFSEFEADVVPAFSIILSC